MSWVVAMLLIGAGFPQWTAENMADTPHLIERESCFITHNGNLEMGVPLHTGAECQVNVLGCFCSPINQGDSYGR